jgi:hypothetical protein
VTSPITTIEQRVTAGNPWTGVLPTTTPVDDIQGVRRFPADVVGGLFTFDFVGPDDSFDQYLIERILVDFGTSATGNVFIVNRDVPVPRRVLIGTVGGGVYLYEDRTLVLAWDERIQLVSVGAPIAEMYARVTAGPLRARS